ncbi:hypothetical protein YWIDRAFT_07933 [Streptomyces sp. SceaMP-e96]|nr:hypothetical protein [Streptomyces sp. SID4951]SCK53983.1 hypothetical protein YWIDRAFT_07933 [Streptomyces sp. SceaMP-e96]
MPSRLPRLENALVPPDEVLGRLQRIRYHQAIEPAEQALLSYFADTLDHPHSVSTSLDRLERATGFSTDDLRPALDYLSDNQREIKLLPGSRRRK